MADGFQHSATAAVAQQPDSDKAPGTGRTMAGLLDADQAPVAIARLRIMAEVIGAGALTDEKLGTIAGEFEPAILSARTYGRLADHLQAVLAALRTGRLSDASGGLRDAIATLQPYVLDPRFCQVALDGLKTFRRKEFTYRFLDQDPELAVLLGKSLHATWVNIEHWLAADRDPNHPRCRRLLEYVDGLKQWGRQRVFLFEVDRDYAAFLTNPAEVRRLVDGVYDRPIFPWDAEEPFIGQVTHSTAAGTDEPLLVFKLIATRHYQQVIDNVLQSFEERSTNFFRIHLREGYAELQLEDLPAGALQDCAGERDRLLAVVRRHLDWSKFATFPLEPVMTAMLHHSLFPIDSVRVKRTGSTIDPDTPVMFALLSAMFENPSPGELSAHWNCPQDLLGDEPVHFRINGRNDYLHFGGIADPVRINELLRRFVETGRKPHGGPPSLWQSGWVGRRLDNLRNHPKAQAVLLSAGAIVSSLLWFVIEKLKDVFFSAAWDRATHGLPIEFVSISVAIIWALGYYGPGMLWRGLKAMASPARPKFWRMLRAAKARSEEQAKNSAAGA